MPKHIILAETATPRGAQANFTRNTDYAMHALVHGFMILLNSANHQVTFCTLPHKLRWPHLLLVFQYASFVLLHNRKPRTSGSGQELGKKISATLSNTETWALAGFSTYPCTCTQMTVQCFHTKWSNSVLPATQIFHHHRCYLFMALAWHP